jgi:ribonuclease P protein component
VLKDGLSKDQPVGRLKRRADFLRVAAARRKWAEPGLVLQVCPQPEPASDPAPDAGPLPGFTLRVGFTASRKVGNAVKRNRARRRLKAIAGEILPAMAKPGYDLVLIARPATIDRPFEALRHDLVQSLKRTQIACIAAIRSDTARSNTARSNTAGESR